jgi:hypothetical protein
MDDVLVERVLPYGEVGRAMDGVRPNPARPKAVR